MVFLKYLSPDWVIFQTDFRLKPCVQDGCFEYNKRYKQSEKNYENFVHKRQKSPQKPEIAGKLELIRQKGFSIRYLWPLIK